MPSHRHKLAELPHQLREHAKNLPTKLNNFREGFQDDPTIIWHSPLTRVILYILGGFLLFAAGIWLINALEPPHVAQNTVEPTPHATIFVACTNPNCRAAYSTQVDRSFANWPLKCQKCNQLSVYRASRCTHCRKWFAQPPGTNQACPFCQTASQPAQTNPTPQANNQPSANDDDEDPW